MRLINARTFKLENFDGPGASSARNADVFDGLRDANSEGSDIAVMGDLPSGDGRREGSSIRYSIAYVGSDRGRGRPSGYAGCAQSKAQGPDGRKSSSAANRHSMTGICMSGSTPAASTSPAVPS